MHWAAWVGHKEITDLLITAGAKVNAKDGDGDTPLDEAVSEDEKETAYLLRNHGGKHGTIHSAVDGGDVKAVKEFLAAAADVNAKRYGWTPLCEAAINGHKEITELLIANGADVNAKDDRGWTPLHLAGSGGQKEIAELLIANAADLNAKDSDGDTPLDWAILNDETETADLLRKHGGKTAEELKAEGK